MVVPVADLYRKKHLRVVVVPEVDLYREKHLRVVVVPEVDLYCNKTLSGCGGSRSRLVPLLSCSGSRRRKGLLLSLVILEGDTSAELQWSQRKKPISARLSHLRGKHACGVAVTTKKKKSHFC